MIDVNAILLGQRLIKVVCFDSAVVFNFEFERARLQVEWLWRITNAEQMLRTSSDDKQEFGLSAPIDALADANSLLSGLVVTRASIRRPTADLFGEFENGNL